MPKVSVIVPVYNVEDYLDKCLNSLVNQTLESIEIVVVNDGATDKSEEIMMKYATEYPDKIKAYSKVNGGLSDARNYGLDYATGAYIGFVDSDDYIDLNMYEVMYKDAIRRQLDVVECDLKHTYTDHEHTEIGKRIIDQQELLMNGRSVVWNKLYRAEWLLATGIKFSKGYIYEDIAFFLKLIPHIKQYGYVDHVYVHYLQRNSSINNMASMKTLDILHILEEVSTYYEENGYYDDYKDALEFFYSRILLCSSFNRMTKIPNRADRAIALKGSWHLLNNRFPNWKRNKHLKMNHSKQGLFMKSVTSATYKIYSFILPLVATLKRKMIRY